MNTPVIFGFKRFRVVFALALALALIAPLGYPSQRARASGPYVVTVISDGPDSNLIDGICTDGVNGCTLRAAIEQASYDGVATSITFDVSIASSTLLLSSTYGTINWTGDYITVDGGTNNITVSGQNLSGGSIFLITGNNNALENLRIANAPGTGVLMGDPYGTGAGNSNMLYNLAIYGNTWGVWIVGNTSGGNGNSVQNSLIGASTWSDYLCATSVNNADTGIYNNGADNTVISNNRIVCSGTNGIIINGSSLTSDNTIISNNVIGTSGNTFTQGNGTNGIHDYLNSHTQIIGNTISGNGNYGVWLQGSNGATIVGNKIGTNETGTSAVPNGYEGLAITDNATNNTIGDGSDALNRNIISGNTLSGVVFTSGANNNVLRGNYIGLGYNGMTAIPNGLAGVAFFNVYNNALSSGSSDTAKQFVSGNTREGIYAENSSYVIVNNDTYIGVAADTTTPAGNGLEGIMLNASHSGIIRPAKVMYNGGAGIAVVGNSATGNKFIPGTIGSNVGLPIDLGNDGHTANGSQTPPGPNDWQIYPSETTPTGASISGISCLGCIIYVYAPIGNPIANNGGGNYLTSITADGTTGAFSYTLPLSLVSVTLIACHPTNNDCSEMSPAYSKTNHHFIFLPAIIRN